MCDSGVVQNKCPVAGDRRPVKMHEAGNVGADILRGMRARVCGCIESAGVRGDLREGRKGAKCGRAQKEQARMFTAYLSSSFINCKTILIGTTFEHEATIEFSFLQKRNPKPRYQKTEPGAPSALL
jgi:hypothetical protein